MGNWTPYALNKHLAPGYADFTAAELPELPTSCESGEHWIANHFLLNVFQSQYQVGIRQLAFTAIYRAQNCVELYNAARALTLKFLDSRNDARTGSRHYFKALCTWEACFLNLQIFVDTIRQIGEGKKLFDSDDGSVEERCYAIANDLKHWASAISRNEHEEDDTVPMWMSNRGFHTRRRELSFIELAALLEDAAGVVAQLNESLST